VPEIAERLPDDLRKILSGLPAGTADAVLDRACVTTIDREVPS
jgi:hypothetical protein